MDAEESPHPQRRNSRKSVTFTEEKLVVDADGSVTMVTTDEPKDSALSHTPPAADAVAPADGSNGDAPEPDLSLMKKKKKSSKKTEDADTPADGDALVEDADGLDLTLKKKKKKKVVKTDDDFAKKLEALDIGDKDKDGEGDDAAATTTQDGDMDQGTGIWAHSESKSIQYDMLLTRFAFLLAKHNGEHGVTSKTYKIPPVQCMREGNKKTIFANIATICDKMHRSTDHVTSFLFAELGTTGSTDGMKRLIIKGKFQPKQIESVLKKYIIEYVSCRTCRSPHTGLDKGENRLYFVTCKNCGSRRTVTAIKTGFAAQVGKRRKMQQG